MVNKVRDIDVLNEDLLGSQQRLLDSAVVKNKEIYEILNAVLVKKAG